MSVSLWIHTLVVAGLLVVALAGAQSLLIGFLAC
jgi:hypothetical protein